LTEEGHRQKRGFWRLEKTARGEARVQVLQEGLAKKGERMREGEAAKRKGSGGSNSLRGARGYARGPPRGEPGRKKVFTNSLKSTGTGSSAILGKEESCGGKKERFKKNETGE